MSALINTSVLLAPAALNVPNAWVGHIPFALWLVEVMQPALLVELGTHSGNSYFAFCQSVVANDLPTQCYAVDTWLGDEQAGYYGDEVYQAVEAYNTAHYSQFSHLLRMTFDEALDRFEDGSIDLLHIDGLHTYEAVLHDFETWRPKLSRRGVVLFHDIAVKERDFGVWRLWEQLAARYRHVSFDHSHGLGVLLVGDALPEALVSLAQGDDDSARRFFGRLGHAVELEYQAIDHVATVARFERELADRDRQVAILGEAVADRDNRIIALGEAVTDRDRRIVALGEAVADRDNRIIALDQENKALQADIVALLASTSWRLTRPLRWCGRHVRRLKRVVGLSA